MPCTYTGSLEGDARLATSEANQKLTEVTQMLCALCTHIEENYEDDIIGEVPKTNKWWKEHKEVDRIRELHETFCNPEHIRNYSVEIGITDSGLNITIEINYYSDRKSDRFNFKENTGAFKISNISNDNEEMLNLALVCMFEHGRTKRQRAWANFLLENFDQINH